MLDIKLVCLGANTEIATIAQINGNELEAVINFNLGDMSSLARNEIVAILQRELNSFTAGELINKLAK